MEDDLMPNDGTYFMPREPKDQILSRKAEQASALQALPVLRDHIARLEERIAFYENNSSIPDDVRLDITKFLILHNSYTLTAATLRSEKEYLEGLIDKYAPVR